MRFASRGGCCLAMKRQLLILIGLIFVGCSLIDDDLSVCGADYYLYYEVKLVTDVDMVIDEKLNKVSEQPIADTLRKWLDPIFSGVAKDLDMKFYSLDERDTLRRQKKDTINAKEKTYTLYIPRENYMHLALVNMDDNNNVSVVGDKHSKELKIEQRRADTLNSHPTAMFTARLPMEMKPEGNESFHVHLYMVNSAVALVVDHSALTDLNMRVVMNGAATGFSVRDSLFTFDNPTVIRAEKLTDQCYALVSLPSASPAQNPVALHRMKQDNTYWQLRTYVTLPDNTITETILSVDYPLLAGALEIIKIEVHDDGSVVPLQNAHVGATVTLDWKDGGSHEINF